MSDLRKERDDLARADQQIADGERRLSDQVLLIERMIKHGHDTTEAKRLLQNYEETLKQWHCHRQLIIHEIARLEGPGSASPVL